MLTCHFEMWWNKKSSEWMLEGRKSGGVFVLQQETSPFGIAFVFIRRRALCTGRSILHWTRLWWQSTGKLMTPVSQFRRLLAGCLRPSSMGRTGWWSHREGWPITWMSSPPGPHRGTNSLVWRGVPTCRPFSASFLSPNFTSYMKSIFLLTDF